MNRWRCGNETPHSMLRNPAPGPKSLHARRVFVLIGFRGCCLARRGCPDAAQSELQALRAQVDELSKLAVRTQSHIMIDVEYQFANLWFAGRNEQWELAAFYLRETDSHLRWTVRVRPVRSIRGSRLRATRERNRRTRHE